MRTSRLPAAQRGLSMVELLVAMALSLIGTVIIFQVFEVSEGIKRTATSGGDAQQNGTIALYVMERDLRNSGMGVNETASAGCNIVGYDSTRTPQNFPVAPATMLLSPARIIPGATATDPDQLTVFYASQTHSAGATTLTADMTSATDPLRVRNRYAFRAGDLILLHEPGTTKNCVIMEVTAVPTAQSDQINHDAGTYTLPGGGGVSARYNPGGGLGVSYGGANTANAARVFNLGNLYDANGITMPVYNTYAVAANTLTVVSAFSSNPAAAVADNIVHLRARYGVDDGVNDGSVTYHGTFVAGDGIVDRFISATPDWTRIIAVRVAVAARSALAEKPSSGTVCDTTTAAPAWSGGTFDLSADANWRCYRYRVFETTVPLRNWIWRSS